MVWRANYSSIYNYRLVFEVHLNIDRIRIEILKGLDISFNPSQPLRIAGLCDYKFVFQVVRQQQEEKDPSLIDCALSIQTIILKWVHGLLLSPENSARASRR